MRYANVSGPGFRRPRLSVGSHRGSAGGVFSSSGRGEQAHAWTLRRGRHCALNPLPRGFQHVFRRDDLLFGATTGGRV
jgi:hypothetical protein